MFAGILGFINGFVFHGNYVLIGILSIVYALIFVKIATFANNKICNYFAEKLRKDLKSIDNEEGLHKLLDYVTEQVFMLSL